MHIHHSSGLRGVSDVSVSAVPSSENALQSGCSKLVSSDLSLLGAVPHASIESKFFEVQRAALYHVASSSRDIRAAALDVLESRGGQPSSKDALIIPFTGKAAGGARRGSKVADSSGSLLRQREQLLESRGFFQGLLDTARTQLAQYQAAGNVQGRLSAEAAVRQHQASLNQVDTEIAAIDAQL